MLLLLKLKQSFTVINQSHEYSCDSPGPWSPSESLNMWVIGRPWKHRHRGLQTRFSVVPRSQRIDVQYLN